MWKSCRRDIWHWWHDIFLETLRPMQEMLWKSGDLQVFMPGSTELIVLGLLFSSAKRCALACSTYANKNMTRVWHLEEVNTENFHNSEMVSLTYLPLPSFLPCFLPSFIPCFLPSFLSGFILFDACCKSIIILILFFDASPFGLPVPQDSVSPTY